MLQKVTKTWIYIFYIVQQNHTMQYTYNVLSTCTPEIYIILFTNVTLINLIINNLKTSNEELEQWYKFEDI